MNSPKNQVIENPQSHEVFFGVFSKVWLRGPDFVHEAGFANLFFFISYCYLPLAFSATWEKFCYCNLLNWFALYFTLILLHYFRQCTRRKMPLTFKLLQSQAASNANTYSLYLLTLTTEFQLSAIIIGEDFWPGQPVVMWPKKPVGYLRNSLSNSSVK